MPRINKKKGQSLLYIPFFYFLCGYGGASSVFVLCGGPRVSARETDYRGQRVNHKVRPLTIIVEVIDMSARKSMYKSGLFSTEGCWVYNTYTYNVYIREVENKGVKLMGEKGKIGN